MELDKKSATNVWSKVFLFSLGISLASAFAMKWIESDFILKGNLFTILGLEFSYTKSEIQFLVSNLDERVHTLLVNHLIYDFAFMAGIYPLIASLCMLSRKKVSGKAMKGLLLFFALIQSIAWVADILENWYLLTWIRERNVNELYFQFHYIVWTKWMIAISGILITIVSLFFRGRKINI